MNEMSSSYQRQTPSSVQTWMPGEDQDRLAEAARDLGLEQHHDDYTIREPLQPVREISQLFLDSLAARMHSVGALGSNERVDAGGTLHYVSVRRRRPAAPKTYGTLSDLFHVGRMKEEVVEVEGEELEEEEVIIEDTIEGGSLHAAMFGIVKGTVGPACLYLPHGFQSSGYITAVGAMLFATSMYIYNAYRLLACWKVESDRAHQLAARIEQVRALLEAPLLTITDEQQEDKRDSSYGKPETSIPFTPTLLTYPELARRAFGPWSLFVELGIASMQFGVCLTYLIYVPQNLNECTAALTGKQLPKTFFLLMMILIEIPLSWIKDIRKLTPTNVLATMLIAYGLCSILLLAFVVGLAPADDANYGTTFQQNLASLPAVTDAWFIFIGTSFFMMEGSITLLVPLQEAVYRPEDKDKFPSLNRNITVWIVVFYIVFSIICVAAFGDGLRTALTASLKGPIATTVQLAYSIAVIFTFPLQAFPAMEVACKAILGNQPKKRQGENDTIDIRRNVLATVLTLLLGVIAICAIDYLGNVVSILGSLFGIPLALVFPPLMHNSLVKDLSRVTRMMNYGVVGIGFGAMAAASFATLVSWNKGAEGG